MWEFIKQNWGSLASVAGLIISVFTLLFAKRASQAAREAKEAVLKSNVVNDLQEAVTTSGVLQVFLQENKWESARLRANDLQDLTIRLKDRWGSKLDPELWNRVLDAKRELQSIIAVLGEMGHNNLSEKEKAKVVSNAMRARNIFLEIHEKFRAKGD